jgi:cytochrome b
VLAATVLFDLVYDDGGWWHRAVGYVAVGAVLARFLWAALAGGRDGFRALMPSPVGTIRYLRDGAPRTAGHDPLGLWMVWLLWLLVLLLGITGWMSRLDAFWGDDLVHDLHAGLADATLVAVVVHLLGVLVMSWRWRENLPLAMLNGRKRDAP